LKVGSIDVLPVLDGLLLSKLPMSKSLPGRDTMAWLQQGGVFRDDGMRESVLGGFLVRSGDRLVLIDAGAGEAIPGGFTPPVINPDDAKRPADRLLSEAWNNRAGAAAAGPRPRQKSR